MSVTPIPVRNPLTGEIDHQVVPPTRDEVVAIAAELRAAQEAWGAAPLEHRVEVLTRWADAVDAHAADIIAAELVDTGHSPVAKVGPMFVTTLLRGWAGRAESAMAAMRREVRSELIPSITARTQLVPYPLVGCISPWNGPLFLSLVDAIPALFAGCAVLIKPSEVAPRFVAPLLASVAEVPELASVLRYVVGDGRTGQDVVDVVDAVCFTGSVPTGRKVAEACARRLIPVFLELGGKDPVIVTASADLDVALTAVLRGSVFSTGQGCASAERIYVHESIHDEFVDRLVELAERVQLHHPDPEAGDLGPFIFERQPAIVDAHLADAVARGAVLRTGGPSEVLGGGIYMRPTVLTEVTNDMRIMQEETFGPVMPVMRYRTEQEAIALANDSEFGLSASVIAGTEEEAVAIAEQLRAGEIAVQDVCLTPVGVWDGGFDPFGASGLGGVRGGPAAIERFLRRKSLLVNSAMPFPLSAGFDPRAGRDEAVTA
jgi:acyl-CoA reductase-like NAD-dependent aldehyde dehydrogenase